MSSNGVEVIAAAVADVDVKDKSLEVGDAVEKSEVSVVKETAGVVPDGEESKKVELAVLLTELVGDDTMDGEEKKESGGESGELKKETIPEAQGKDKEKEEGEVSEVFTIEDDDEEEDKEPAKTVNETVAVENNSLKRKSEAAEGEEEAPAAKVAAVEEVEVIEAEDKKETNDNGVVA